MAGADDSPFPPLLNELARVRRSNLTAAIGDVDKIINLLANAREQVAAGIAAFPPNKPSVRSASTDQSLSAIQMRTHIESAWR